MSGKFFLLGFCYVKSRNESIVNSASRVLGSSDLRRNRERESSRENMRKAEKSRDKKSKKEWRRATMIKRGRSRLYMQRNSEQQREIEREKVRQKRQRSSEEQGEKS